MPTKREEGNLYLYFRILSFFRPYIRIITLVLFLNFLFIMFSTVSIWMVAPLISTIFESPDQPAASVSIVDNSGQSDTSIFDLNQWLKEKINVFFQKETKTETLKFLCIMIFLLFFFKNIIGFLQSWWVAFIEQRFIKDMRDSVYEHMLWQPLSFFSRYQTGNLMSRITNDINVLNESLEHNFTKIIRDPFMILIFVVLLISISWQLSLVASIVFPLTGLLIGKIGQSLKRKSRRVQERIADVTTVLQETITGINVVKAFSMEKYESDKFNKKTYEHFRTALRKTRLHRLSGPLSEVTGIGIMVCVLWYGGQLVLTGQLLSSEDFIRFIAILFSLMDPIKKMGEINNDIQISLASGRRIFDILDAPIAITDKPDAMVKTDFTGQISYKQVSFSYPGSEELVLNELSLAVKKGEKFAIVGGSGAGKTTLVNLLPRFYDVNGGAVCIDGIDIRDITMDSLRKLMGIVTQDVILFNDTVANNIAYGLADYSRDEILRAAKLANAHPFIEQMPEGYETMIGERGTRLSGGQRQRISIARAILKNPPILIFDEATSSLDSEAEHLIQQAIENLIQQRTVLIIAHRLSTIMNSDKIIVLEEGKIIDRGTHDQLLERSERYRYLYELQFSV